MSTSVCRTHGFQSSALVHFKENTQFTKMLEFSSEVFRVLVLLVLITHFLLVFCF